MVTMGRSVGRLCLGTWTVAVLLTLAVRVGMMHMVWLLVPYTLAGAATSAMVVLTAMGPARAVYAAGKERGMWEVEPMRWRSH